MKRVLATLTLSACFVLCGTQFSSAGVYTAAPRLTGGGVETPGAALWGPGIVGGKELVSSPNRGGFDAGFAADAGQVVAWDGVGGSANAAVDFGVAVDAIANGGDTLFSHLVANEVSLLYHTTGDGDVIRAERTTGAVEIWAASVDPDAAPPYEIDGLEVWGPDGPAAANSDRYSEALTFGGDQIFDGLGTALVSAADIAAAIDPLFAAAVTAADINVDALMMFGNEILMSLAPADLDGGGIALDAGDIDGGEIFYWTGVGPASFLSHGGHLWDTSFSVLGTGAASENVNALEAMTNPEPTSLSLLGLGCLCALRVRRRRGRA